MNLKDIALALIQASTIELFILAIVSITIIGTGTVKLIKG